MMWFARGRLWPSPEAAREALVRQRTRPRFQTGRPRGTRGCPRPRAAPRQEPRGDSARPPANLAGPSAAGRRERRPGTRGGDADGGPAAPTPTRAIDSKCRVTRNAGDLRRSSGATPTSRGLPGQAAAQDLQEEGRRQVIAHLVLLTPRPELAAADRAAAIGALARAAARRS